MESRISTFVQRRIHVGTTAHHKCRLYYFPSHYVSVLSALQPNETYVPALEQY
jgi:hypothetical protein